MKTELTTEQLTRIENIMFNLANIEEIRRALRDLSTEEFVVLHEKATSLAVRQMKIADAVTYGLAARRAADWAKEMEEKLND
jgi:hypothetical protein